MGSFPNADKVVSIHQWQTDVDNVPGKALCGVSPVCLTLGTRHLLQVKILALQVGVKNLYLVAGEVVQWQSLCLAQWGPGFKSQHWKKKSTCILSTASLGNTAQGGNIYHQKLWSLIQRPLTKLPKNESSNRTKELSTDSVYSPNIKSLIFLTDCMIFTAWILQGFCSQLQAYDSSTVTSQVQRACTSPKTITNLFNLTTTL
jgi:hypothetical protein